MCGRINWHVGNGGGVSGCWCHERRGMVMGEAENEDLAKAIVVLLFDMNYTWTERITLVRNLLDVSKEADING
jgi:hypothetical protein